jgi:hypothetical protein
MGEVIDSAFLGEVSGFKNGANPRSYWAIIMKCGHAQTAATDDDVPPAELDCVVCALPENEWVSDKSKELLETIFVDTTETSEDNGNDDDAI